MDETRLRAIIREEIALAMKTLGGVAGSAAPSLYAEDRKGEADGAYAVENAANPFTETAPTDEVAEKLREIRDSLRDSGAHSAHIRDLDRLIAGRMRANPFEDAEPAVDPAVKTLSALAGAARELDMPYETSELESRALAAIAQAAERAVTNCAEDNGP